MKIYRISARKESNNQMINKVVVQILFMVTGRPSNYSAVANALIGLRDSGELNIGNQIMQRMEDSLRDEHTIWFNLSEEEKVELRNRFRAELLTAMKMVANKPANQL